MSINNTVDWLLGGVIYLIKKICSITFSIKLLKLIKTFPQNQIQYIEISYFCYIKISLLNLIYIGNPPCVRFFWNLKPEWECPTFLHRYLYLISILVGVLMSQKSASWFSWPIYWTTQKKIYDEHNTWVCLFHDPGPL